MLEITPEYAIKWFENRRDGITMPGAKAMYGVAIAALRAQMEAEELLKHAPEWISVKDKLPENEKAVLAYAETRKARGEVRGHVVKAFYTDGKHTTDDSAFEWDTDYLSDSLRYDPENDRYYVPEGWWESVRYSDEFSAVDDFVTHWMPLPEAPKGVNADE